MCFIFLHRGSWTRAEAGGSPVVARGLAPTRAPHIHPTAPCHYIWDDHPAPRRQRGGPTLGVVGQATCSGTGLGTLSGGQVWGWMGPYGCQAQSEPKCVWERGWGGLARRKNLNLTQRDDLSFPIESNAQLRKPEKDL